MLFNSLDFALFLPIVFLCYWFVFNKNLRIQNLFIVLISYIFYGWWDWRFLSLIIFSTFVDFTIGSLLRKEKNAKRRKIYVWTSVLVNLGFLGFFKYYNFFIDSFINSFSFFGKEIGLNSLNIILPVGISFYTFQTLSYTLDVYKKKLDPIRDVIAFSAFVSFFPQLVAGPIERASNLLPQILNKRQFNHLQISEGLRLMIWGLFKKVVIADSLAPIVDDIFSNQDVYPSSTLFLGAILFGFQIYGDFSGYSDIAIGTAKLFGVELMSNFKFPYFSKSISEFWRRWHISLSTWFRDYLYIPLGGSKVAKVKVVRNIFIIFIVSGFWHGANWTFIVWGMYHAVLFLPIYFSGNKTKHIGASDSVSHKKNYIIKIARVFFTFLMVTLGWVFFRSSSLKIAFDYLNEMLFGFTYDYYMHPMGYRMIDYYILLLLFVLFEYLIRKDERNPLSFKNGKVRFVCYGLMVFLMLLFYDGGVDRSFIYFQF